MSIKKFFVFLSLVILPSLTFAEVEANKEDLLKQMKSDIVIGKEDAPITIIEYASMSCSHCASFHRDTYPELKKEYIDTGKVKFIFRDFPLDESALRASMLIRCVDKENFENFLKVIFKTQGNWVGKKNYLEKLSNIAGLGGVPKEKFDSCIKDEKLEKQILQTRLDASNKLEIRSTPTIFINGKKHSGDKSFEYLKEILDEILEK